MATTTSFGGLSIIHGLTLGEWFACDDIGYRQFDTRGKASITDFFGKKKQSIAELGVKMKDDVHSV
jgi:hypothetical protein